MINTLTVRLPDVRFTLRQIMAALAVVALLCWAGRLLMLSAMYAARAKTYSAGLLGATPRAGGGKEWPRVYHPLSPGVRWARAMAHKYEHAASHPWIPVEPDLPEPG
jgi:hypothetical protein